MAKIWRIARNQIQQEAGKRSFLIVLFSLPLFLGLTIGMGYLAVQLENEPVTLGYVDQTGLLTRTLAEPDQDVQMAPYGNIEAASAALEAEEIDAYIVLGPEHAGIRRAEIVCFEPPSPEAIDYFIDMVRLNLMAGQPAAVAERVLVGAEVTVRAVDSNREYPDGGPDPGGFVPIAAAVIFSFLVLTTSGYMMQAVVVEKENRTMEVLVSSVSPVQMMAGKIIGALTIGLMQLVVWVAFLVGAMWLGGSVLEIEWLQGIQPNWRDLVMTLIVALPSYLFLASLMTAVGSTLVDTQEAQQLGSLFFLPLLIPIYLIVPITQNSNGPLSMVLSLFPLTSVSTIALRSLIMQVPAWQIAASASISLICGILMVWIAAKAFRVSMLRYGQRLRWREIFRREAVSAPASGGS